MRATAASDWSASLRAWRLWVALGLEDITDRYRRTSIGAAWIAVSFALFVAVKVSIFGTMVPTSLTDFGLHVAIGFGLWTFISAVLLDGCTAFVQARAWILGTATPYPVYFFQVAFRNLVMLAVVGVVMALALAWKLEAWSWGMASAALAIPVYLVTPLWLTALLAPTCARFPDFQQAMVTFVRLLFFVTPILWMPDLNEHLARIAWFNPVTHYIEIVRTPLLEGRLPLDSWAWVVAITAAGIPAASLAYRGTRRNVVFWV